MTRAKTAITGKAARTNKSSKKSKTRKSSKTTRRTSEPIELARDTRPVREDAAREHRIVMEIVVDAYGSSERAMGWYYYLDGKLQVPFAARCRAVRAISPLAIGEPVEVLGMAPEEECEKEMFVWVRREGGRIAVPLMQLQPLSVDGDTQEAVADRHYWLARGYEL